MSFIASSLRVFPFCPLEANPVEVNEYLLRAEADPADQVVALKGTYFPLALTFEQACLMYWNTKSISLTANISFYDAASGATYATSSFGDLASPFSSASYEASFADRVCGLSDWFFSTNAVNLLGEVGLCGIYAFSSFTYFGVSARMLSWEGYFYPYISLAFSAEEDLRVNNVAILYTDNPGYSHTASLDDQISFNFLGSQFYIPVFFPYVYGTWLGEPRYTPYMSFSPATFNFWDTNN